MPIDAEDKNTDQRSEKVVEAMMDAYVAALSEGASRTEALIQARCVGELLSRRPVIQQVVAG